MRSNKLQWITILFITLTLLSAYAGANIEAFLYDYDLFAKGVLGIAVFYLLYKGYINSDTKLKNINGLNIQLSLAHRIGYLLLSFCVADVTLPACYTLFSFQRMGSPCINQHSLHS